MPMNMPNKSLVFIIYPALGHLQAAMDFASYMEKSGYKVTFFCLYNARQIINNKFSCREILHSIYPVNYKETRYKSTPTFIRALLKHKKTWFVRYLAHIFANSNERKKEYYVLSGSTENIDQLVGEINPNAFIIDNFLYHYYFFLSKYNRKIIFLNTMLSGRNCANIPPLNSKIIPTHGIGNKILVNLSWKYYRFRKGISNLIKFILQCREEYYKKKLMYSFCYKNDCLEKQHYGYTKIKNTNEIVLCDQAFEFGSINNKKIIHINVVPDLCENSEHNKNHLLNKKFIVYCSLGTLNYLTKYNRQFFNNVIRAFANDSQFDVYLSIGGRINCNELINYSDNIIISNSLNQRNLLQKADVAITHAGLNTVKECIMSCTPMLAFPFANDGWGNAARVVRHGIGIQGDIKKSTPGFIYQAIHKLLKSKCYINNIKYLHDSFCDSLNNPDIRNKIITLFE
jgi:zeaxanthin glucosyltransferase